MPTVRPRHQVTETPDIARALEIAARRWPGESRSKLLLRLVHTGSDVLDRASDEAAQSRLQAISASSGKYTGVFGSDFLTDLRGDWPE